MPAYNVEAYVGEALASLHAQTGGDFELIAVDDGSHDATGTILEEWRPRLGARDIGMEIVRRPNGGLGAARNEGLVRARGRLLCILDADDRLYPEALAVLADELERDDTLDLVFPQCRHVDEEGHDLGIVSDAAPQRHGAIDLIFANPIHTSSGVMLRRARAEEAGRFNTALPACIDLDFLVRATAHRADNIAAVPRVLVDYRTRPGQITGDWRRLRRGWEMMVAHAEEVGLRLSRPARKAALARNALTWATIAYKHGQYKDARRLALEFWRCDARFALLNAHARVRTAACLASLLPAPLHNWIRDRYNADR